MRYQRFHTNLKKTKVRGKVHIFLLRLEHSPTNLLIAAKDLLEVVILKHAVSTVEVT
jgi:hypothetical protein